MKQPPILEFTICPPLCRLWLVPLLLVKPSLRHRDENIPGPHAGRDKLADSEFPGYQSESLLPRIALDSTFWTKQLIESLYLKRGAVLDEFLQLSRVFDEQIRCSLGNGQSALVFPREAADWLVIRTTGSSTARPAERARKASVVQFQQPVEFRLAG